MSKLSKVTIFISIIIIVIISGFFIFKSRNPDIKIYQFDMTDTDLALSNFTVVSIGNSYYIPDNYIINIVGKNKEIKNVIFQVKNNETLITDVAFQFPNDTKINAPTDVLNSNCNINDDTVLTIKFKYDLNNVSKEAYQSISLKKHKKNYNEK